VFQTNNVKKDNNSELRT